MIILKEKKQPLNEMAQFKAAGIVVKIYSDDHGALGNINSPAHAHVFDATGKRELGIIILTENPPKSPADIQWYRTPNPPTGLGKAVVKFANMTDSIANQSYKISTATNWETLIHTWRVFYG